jgi:hypothetical protein
MTRFFNLLKGHGNFYFRLLMFWTSGKKFINLVYHRLILTNKSVFIVQCPAKDLECPAVSYFSNWVQLATSPYGTALDSTKMFLPVALPRGSRSRAAAKISSARLEHESSRMISFGSTGENSSHERHFEVSSNVPKIIVGADSDKSVTHTRVLTAMALGLFAAKLPVGSWQVVLTPLANDVMSSSGVQRQVCNGPIILVLISSLLNYSHCTYLFCCSRLLLWLLFLGLKISEEEILLPWAHC